MTVFDLGKGGEGVVVRTGAAGGAAERLYSLGLKAGVRVRVLGYSLFKSSVMVSFGAVRLGIRRALAQKIEVRQ